MGIMLELSTSHKTIKVFARQTDDGLLISEKRVSEVREWLGEGHISIYGNSKKYGTVDSCILPGEKRWTY
jgi:hypothetical protein